MMRRGDLLSSPISFHFSRSPGQKTVGDGRLCYAPLVAPRSGRQETPAEPEPTPRDPDGAVHAREHERQELHARLAHLFRLLDGRRRGAGSVGAVGKGGNGRHCIRCGWKKETVADADVYTSGKWRLSVLRERERFDEERLTELQRDETVQVGGLGLVDQQAQQVRQRAVDDFADPREDEKRPEYGEHELDRRLCDDREDKSRGSEVFQSRTYPST